MLFFNDCNMAWWGSPHGIWLEMTAGTPILNKKSHKLVLDDLSSVSIHSTLGASQVWKLNYTGVVNEDHRRPTSDWRDCFGQWHKIEAEQTMARNTLNYRIFSIAARKWRTARDAEAGHAAWNACFQVPRLLFCTLRLIKVCQQKEQ